MQTKRRDLLKALTIGGGAVATTQVPSTWSKPVVESVILPAHAQTTESETTSTRTFFGGASPFVSIKNDADTMFARASRTLVTDAHARVETNGTVCATELSNGRVKLTFQNRKNTVRRRVTLDVGGSDKPMKVIAVSPGYGCSLEYVQEYWTEEARIISISDDELIWEFNHSENGRARYSVMRSSSCNLPPLDGEGECSEDVG